MGSETSIVLSIPFPSSSNIAYMSALQRHKLVSEVVEGGHEDEAGDGGGLGLRVGEGAGGDGGPEGVTQHFAIFS